MNAVGPRAVPVEQRVFSLVLALVASPSGVTRHELLSSVHGYADRYVMGGENGALERQFERDKEQLRALGIRIETLDSPREPGNNQLTRYRISKELLEFPRDVRFSERELMLLRLAALSWSEGSMTDESRRAAMKLRALGAGTETRQLGIAPLIGEADASATQLRRGIEGRRVVEFDYLLPGRDAPLRRRVAPLRLHRADGRWHLMSWDIERDAPRVFLLSRIRSDVAIERARFDAELLDRTDGMITDLLRQAERVRARVAVLPGSVAEARLAGRGAEADAGTPSEDGWPVLSVRTLDVHALAEEIAGYGPDAVVREPAELRDLVVSRLRGIALAHGGGDA